MQTPGGTFFLHTDGQGDVTALSDGTGAVLETYLYDAFGNVTATQTGPTAAPAEPLLFQGQLLDPTTGLYDMRARNYDPSTGRFTQRDPVAPLIGQPVFSPYVFARRHADDGHRPERQPDAAPNRRRPRSTATRPRTRTSSGTRATA